MPGKTRVTGEGCGDIENRYHLVEIPLRLLVLPVAFGLSLFSAPLPAHACEDVVLPLDDAMQRPDGFGDLMTRDTSLFMLKGLVPTPETTVTDEATAWRLACDALAPDLAAGLRATLAFDGTLDPRALRELFERRYLESVAARGHDAFVKPTLWEFRRLTGFNAWEQTIVEVSMVKRKTRRIFRSPAGFLPVVSVAETLETETGDPSAAVRETEVAIKRRTSEDWDFYAYDAQGALSTVSTFPAGERPSPRICIACHYDGGSRAVERFFP